MKQLFFLILVSSLTLFLSCERDKNIESEAESIIEFYSEDNNITLVNPVMRPSAKGMNSAIFLGIKNNSSTPDTLIAVESDIAELVEIHETFRLNKDKMGMRHAENVVIQADSVTTLKPGSYHIMLIDLYEDATVGKKVEAKLFFKLAGEIKFTAIVENL